MGKMKAGITGPVSGSANNLVFYERNGVTCFRSKPKQYRDKKSDKQLAQRRKMALASEVYGQMGELMKRSYRNPETGASGYNRAFSHLIKEAVIEKEGEWSVDYSLVKIAKGALVAPNVIKSEVKDQQLSIAWDVETSREGASNEVLVAAYDEKGFWFRYLPVQRRDGACTVALPKSFDQVLYVWLAFYDLMNEAYSDSTCIDMSNAL